MEQGLPSTHFQGNGTFAPSSECLDSVFFDCSSALNCDLFTEPDYFEEFLHSSPVQSLSIPLDPTCSTAAIFSRDTVNYIISILKTYPIQFLQQFHTPFIHPLSYHDSLPRPIQDALLLCSAYSTKTAANNDFVFRILEHRVKDLVQSYQIPLTFTDSLAYVQSLVLLQIIQLFDGDIRQRAIAEEHDAILVHWTELLQQQAQDPLLLSSLPGRHAWYMAESARRTVIMSVMLRAVYNIAKNGISNIPGMMAQLPFTPASELWDGNSAIVWKPNGCTTSRDVVFYRDFANWCETAPPAAAWGLSFEHLLLVACKGVRFVSET